MRVSCALANVILPGGGVLVTRKNVEGLLWIGAVPLKLRFVPVGGSHLFRQCRASSPNRRGSVNARLCWSVFTIN